MFAEANTVEQMILDVVTKLGDKPAFRMREGAPPYRGESLGDDPRPLGDMSVQADGLVRVNENFMAWPRGEKTKPFGKNGEHVPVHLVNVVQI
jgi:hypothetical protein